MTPLTGLTFCDGDGDKRFTALAVVRTRVAYGRVVGPDSVRLVSGCMTHICMRIDKDVPRALVDLMVPALGFMDPDTVCTVLGLSSVVIQVTDVAVRST